MKIFELFDKGFPYTWEDQNNEQWRASFEVNGIEYSASIVREKGFVDNEGNEIEDLWDIGFSPSDNVFDIEVKGGTEAEFKIFSTVVSAAKEFIQNVQPTYFSISASKKEEKRFPLYMKILNRFINQLKNMGYEEIECPDYRDEKIDKRIKQDYHSYCMKRSK